MWTIIDSYVWKHKEKEFEEFNEEYYKGLSYMTPHFLNWYDQFFDVKKIPGWIIDEVLYD